MTLSNAINGDYDAGRIQHLMQRCREEADRARDFKGPVATPKEASPHALFDAARNDIVVQVAIDLWRRGDLPLENALILAVASLVERNKELTSRLTGMIDRSPLSLAERPRQLDERDARRRSSFRDAIMPKVVEKAIADGVLPAGTRIGPLPEAPANDIFSEAIPWQFDLSKNPVEVMFHCPDSRSEGFVRRWLLNSIDKCVAVVRGDGRAWAGKLRIGDGSFDADVAASPGVSDEEVVAAKKFVTDRLRLDPDEAVSLAVFAPPDSPAIVTG